MKTIAIGFVAAALGFAALSAPASAATTVQSQTSVAAPMTDVSAQGYVRKSVTVRRGPVCTVRVVRTRGPMGRVVVRKTRICR